ncbi:MAG TPA: hypothetical protein VGH09_06040 [Solirubrobacteraceae bacterium]|jgi:hypothetical protein
MRLIRIIGLCLVAVFALGTIGASSASALPEFGKCVAKAGGKYTDSNCTAKTTTGGTFDRVKASAITHTKFTSKSGTTYLEGESGLKIVCEESSTTGELNKTGTNVAAKGVKNVVLKWTGCEGCACFMSCQNKGAARGEIVSNTLQGNLVYANKAKKEVLQELHPKVNGGAFASFECGSGAVIVIVKEEPVSEGGKEGHNCIFGSIPVADVNVMSPTGHTNFVGSGTDEGRQIPQTDEKLKPAKCNLEEEVSGGKHEFVSLNQELTTTFEEPIELFA